MRQTLNKDQFAKWFMTTATESIRMYLFDSMYDIRHIMESNNIALNTHHKDTGSRTNEPIYNILYWFNRETGSDICNSDEDIYKTYLNNNTNAFKMTFCVNADYFSNESYCTIEKIK